MRTRYTVWEWDEFNGWSLYLGSNSFAMADQVKRALKTYAAPQHFFGVYGPYEVAATYEIVGKWGTRYYSWGWCPNPNFANEIIYGLSKALRPDVIVYAKEPLTGNVSATVYDAMPYWWREEIKERRRTAGVIV